MREVEEAAENARKGRQGKAMNTLEHIEAPHIAFKYSTFAASVFFFAFVCVNPAVSGDIILGEIDNNIKFGTIATPDEMCSSLKHNFVAHEATRYDISNRQVVWDPDGISVKWIAKRRADLGVRTDRHSSHSIVAESVSETNANLSECLRNISRSDPSRYNNVKKFFISSLANSDVQCFEKNYRKYRESDDLGNIVEKKIELPSRPCADFVYDGGSYLANGQTVFLVMLTTKEANPLLLNLFNEAEAKIQNQINAEKNREKYGDELDRVIRNKQYDER